MKKHITFLGILIIALSSCNSEASVVSITNTPIYQTVATIVTPTSTTTPQSEFFPVEFPLPILTQQQIQEVSGCKIQELANERYPENIKMGDLSKSFAPVSDCDLAVLSYGYAVRNTDDAPSQQGLEAFKKAISNNYGFALTSFVFDYYFDSVPIVKAPEFVNQEIVKVEINYTWSGLGEPSQVTHSLTIDNASINPIVSSSTDTISNNTALDKETIQDLAKGLSNLLPIDSEIQLVYCYDNYPEWFVTLIFTDGTKIDMKSNSNFLYTGGPWLTEIDGQVYIQFSQAFAVKIDDLMKILELPLGEPAAMYCHGGVVFENAFSRFLPPTSTPIPNFTMEAIFTAAAQTVEVQLTQNTAGTPTPKP